MEGSEENMHVDISFYMYLLVQDWTAATAL